MPKTLQDLKDRYQNDPKLWKEDGRKIDYVLTALQKSYKAGKTTERAKEINSTYCNLFLMTDEEAFPSDDQPDKLKSAADYLKIVQMVEKNKKLLTCLTEKTMEGKTNYQALIDYVKETAAGKGLDPEQAAKQIDDGIQTLSDVYELGIDLKAVQETGRETGKKAGERQAAGPDKGQNAPQSKTALAWTEQYKAAMKEGSVRESPDYPARFYARYMAARALSESRRGDKSTLNREMTEQEINAHAEKLMENETFRKFMEKAKDDKKLLGKLESAAKSGHGGGIDDLFHDHLRDLEPGKLENDELLSRYMPTALERIESVQKQMKNASGQDKLTGAAEIVTLRNLVHAERNRKSTLDKKIPCKDTKSLQNGIGGLTANKVLNEKLLKSGALDEIRSGHGGKMVEDVRDFYTKNNVGGSIYDNTVAAHMGRCKQSLRILLDGKTDSVRSVEQQIAGKNNAYHEAKELMGQYIALCGMNDKLGPDKDVPWETLNKQMSGKTGQDMLEQLDGDEMGTLLHAMLTKEPDRFLFDVGKKLGKQLTEKTERWEKDERKQQKLQDEYEEMLREQDEEFEKDNLTYI